MLVHDLKEISAVCDTLLTGDYDRARHADPQHGVEG